MTPPRDGAYVRIDCERIGGASGKAETEKAIMIEVAGEEYWIPFDHCTEVHRDSDPPHIYIARWLAQREGLI